jgi:hypothetical protein
LVLGSNSTNESPSSSWLHDTGHRFDCEDMGSKLNEFVGNPHVILKIVFAIWPQHVSSIHDGTLYQSANSEDGVDTDLQVLEVIERIEHSDDIDSGVFCVLHEAIECVVRQPAKAWCQ